MTTLRIDTEDSKILNAIRAILESFEVPFEEVRSESAYDPEFVKKINKSLQQADSGQTVKIDLDEIWK